MPSKMNLIKNLTPWMLDELLAFSEITGYSIVLLREQDNFYSDSIQELINNGVEIYVKPFTRKNFLKKLYVTL